MSVVVVCWNLVSRLRIWILNDLELVFPMRAMANETLILVLTTLQEGVAMCHYGHKHATLSQKRVLRVVLHYGKRGGRCVEHALATLLYRPKSTFYTPRRCRLPFSTHSLVPFGTAKGSMNNPKLSIPESGDQFQQTYLPHSVVRRWIMSIYLYTFSTAEMKNECYTIDIRHCEFEFWMIQNWNSQLRISITSYGTMLLQSCIEMGVRLTCSRAACCLGWGWWGRWCGNRARREIV